MNSKILSVLTMAACLSVATVAQNTPKYSNDGRHKGLDFNLSTGYHIGVGDNKNSGSVPIEVGLGKQFHPNIYVGLGSGVWIGTSKGAKPQIPITADAKIMFPPQQASIIKPMVSVRLGYLLNTAGTIKTEYGEYDPPSFVLMEIMPGLQFPFNRKSDFLLSAGYTHGFSTKSSNSSGGYFSVKLGLNFHKDPDKPKRPKREKVPTRTRGLQFTLEGNMNVCGSGVGGGGNLVCTYKLNPHFSVGGGVGNEKLSPFAYSNGMSDRKDADVQVLSVSNSGVYESFYQYCNSKIDYGSNSESIGAFNVFARGTYHFITRRCSPFVSIDAGVRKYDSFDVDMGVESSKLKGPKTTRPFVMPSVGLSVPPRTTHT